jgi:S1-C subfamily serine protease
MDALLLDSVSWRAALRVTALAGALGLVAGCGKAPPSEAIDLARDHFEVEPIGLQRWAVGASWWEGAVTPRDLLGAGAGHLVASTREGEPGVVIRTLGPDAKVARLGLRSGDRVYKVRGQSVATPEEFVRLFSAFEGAGLFTVQLYRQGQPHTFIYEVR